MTKKRFWVGMMAMMLTFGIAVIGCDNGSTSDNGSPNETISHDGTWIRGTDQLITSGNIYSFRTVFGGNLIEVSRGTFIAPLSATSGAFAINQTHEINFNGQLVANAQTETGTFSIVGNTLILAGFSYFPINGTWIR